MGLVRVLCVVRIFRIEVLGEKLVGIGVVLPGLGGGCKVCKVYLCRKSDCVRQFHKDMNEIDPIE